MIRVKFRAALIVILVTVAGSTCVITASLLMPYWRAHSVQKAVLGSEAPRYWWPPSWRREYGDHLAREAERRKLLTPVRVEQLPSLATLPKLLEALETQTGLQFVVDSEIPEENPQKIESVFLLPILDRLSLRSVLRTLLETRDLAYYLDDNGALVINSKLAVRSLLTPRTSPVLCIYDLDALCDVRTSVRRDVAYALGQNPVRARMATNALVAALQDSDKQVRFDCAFALGELGPDADQAIPALIELLTQEDDALRFSAAVALGKIGPAALDCLISALENRDSVVAAMAAYALGEMGQQATPAITALFDAVNAAPDDLADNAFVVSAVTRINPPTVIPMLVDALRDQNAKVRVFAASSLGEFRASAGAAVPALIAAIKDENPKVRQSVVDSLGRIGPAARAAIPALREAMNDPVDPIPFLAADALDRILQENNGINDRNEQKRLDRE